eukprot:jgi/Tetstr1/428248/TSEL_018288.t2
MSWHGDCRKGVTDAQGQAAGAGACLGNSPSNGGSERFNRTIEEKVRLFCCLQSLRLSDDLANSLTTEADLNAALGLP